MHSTPESRGGSESEAHSLCALASIHHYPMAKKKLTSCKLSKALVHRRKLEYQTAAAARRRDRVEHFVTRCEIEHTSALERLQRAEGVLRDRQGYPHCPSTQRASAMRRLRRARSAFNQAVQERDEAWVHVKEAKALSEALLYEHESDNPEVREGANVSLNS